MRETKQSVVVLLPYENPLHTEIVELFSKYRHLRKASRKPLIRPLSLKHSYNRATRFLHDNTPIANIRLCKDKLVNSIPSPQGELSVLPPLKAS